MGEIFRRTDFSSLMKKFVTFARYSSPDIVSRKYVYAPGKRESGRPKTYENVLRRGIEGGKAVRFSKIDNKLFSFFYLREFFIPKIWKHSYPRPAYANMLNNFITIN